VDVAGTAGRAEPYRALDAKFYRADPDRGKRPPRLGFLALAVYLDGNDGHDFNRTLLPGETRKAVRLRY
jgi:hypothetical protein